MFQMEESTYLLYQMKQKRITKLPTQEEVKLDSDRAISYARDIILNAGKYKDMDLDEDILKQYTCNLDPLLDKILAINLADILNRQSQYKDNEQLKNVWITSIEELKQTSKRIRRYTIYTTDY